MNSYTLLSELHCHSNDELNRLSYLPVYYDSIQTTAKIIDTCLIKNIKILSITDHDSLYGYQQASRQIKEQGIDLILVPGCEISSKDGHILAYGITSLIPKFLSAKETIKLIHQQGGIAVAAHPFMINSLKQKIFDLDFDGLEVNASIPSRFNHQAALAADRLHLPLIAGSDAHGSSIIGHGSTVFPNTAKNTHDIIECLKKGDFQIQVTKPPMVRHLIQHFLKGNILTYRP